MSRSQSWKWVIVAILCVSAYLGYFFSLDLPNSPPTDAWGKRISRLTIWAVTVPGLVPNTPSPIGQALQQLQHFHSLLQRIPVIASATLILLAAGGIGDVVLRVWNSLWRRGIRSPVAEHWWDPLERAVFAFGLGATSISLGMLGLGLIGWMSRVVIMTLLAIAAAWFSLVAVRTTHRWCCAGRDDATSSTNTGLGLSTRANQNSAITCGVLASGLFLLISLLGAMLPATDFDVLEYHLQGPKEYYLAGRISFAPHNVYMNMPFGTEMLSLLGMIVAGDWWWGGLVGQTVLACYAPLTAVGIAQLGRRCFGTTAGWFGAFIYLTTPWVYRISVIPLTENALAFYLLAATLAARRAVDEPDGRLRSGNWLLAGVLAGSAAACKYTALTSTVAPIGIGALLVAAVQWRKQRPSTTSKLWWGPAAVALGVLLAVGPWLVRNAAWTGNPTYPLFYNLFGGRNWTAEKNAKWEWGHRVALFVALGIHRPPPGMTYDPRDPQHAISPRHLIANLHNVAVQSDWLSPLLFSLAPLALVGSRGRRSARWLCLLVGFLFFQWWLLTHRNDRFWVPMPPIVAVLAGGGCVWCDRAVWRRFLALIIPPVVLFNLSFCTTSLCGYNQFGAELIPRRHPFDETGKWLSDHLPPPVRLLAVGEAAFFHFDRAVIYNTVFDDCWFVVWLDKHSPAQAAAELKRRGITHVFVNWYAIQRHRSPDGYGFPAQVTPSRFQELVANGVLKRLPFDVADLAEPVSLDGYEVSPREIFEVTGSSELAD